MQNSCYNHIGRSGTNHHWSHDPEGLSLKGCGLSSDPSITTFQCDINIFSKWLKRLKMSLCTVDVLHNDYSTWSIKCCLLKWLNAFSPANLLIKSLVLIPMNKEVMGIHVLTIHTSTLTFAKNFLSWIGIFILLDSFVR